MLQATWQTNTKSPLAPAMLLMMIEAMHRHQCDWLQQLDPQVRRSKYASASSSRHAGTSPETPPHPRGHYCNLELEAGCRGQHTHTHAHIHPR